MENMYVTFTVKVSDVQYSYQGNSVDAEMAIQVPRSVLRNIDPGNLFAGILQAALERFDAEAEANDENASGNE